MRYLIHTCKQRMWYVRDFLIPSLKSQGINQEDIVLYLDEKEEGCLKSFIESSRKYCHGQGTWHLQDDVLICRDFKERTEQYNRGIVCGFTCIYDEGVKPGKRLFKDGTWWSFPCIYIPDDIMEEFVAWTDATIWTDRQYKRYADSKKYDDFIFKVFMEMYHPDVDAVCLAPNLVNHIDYLIGGTVVNPQRSASDVTSIYWDDKELVHELEKEINAYKLRHNKARVTRT